MYRTQRWYGLNDVDNSLSDEFSCELNKCLYGVNYKEIIEILNENPVVDLMYV
jgi:hypothetical protein